MQRKTTQKPDHLRASQHRTPNPETDQPHGHRPGLKTHAQGADEKVDYIGGAATLVVQEQLDSLKLII
jgi:hypothetical protein